MAILTQRGLEKVAQEDDMTGTILVCVIFGMLLLFKGKIYFGSIYGFGLSGCTGICVLIKLLTRRDVQITLYGTISVLGYCLLPFCFLALASVFLNLVNPVGLLIIGLTVMWSAVAATRLFEYSLEMQDQKYLIMYPIVLFYCVFVLLTLF